MFKTVPKISNTETYFKNNVFNINLQLKDDVSTVRNDLTKFGVLITQTDKQIAGYSPSYQQSLSSDSRVIFLSADSNYSIKEKTITCNLSITMEYNKESNKIIYVTPFYYQEEFKNVNNNIVYTFSTTQTLTLIRNSSLDTSVLDYGIVDEVNNLNLDLLSSDINYQNGISQLYTSFSDRYKANNYFFVNHAILSKFQKDKISNIINYNSTLIKSLLKPNIKISNKKKVFDFTLQNIQQISYVYFNDEIHNLKNCEYKVKISYNFSSIYSIFTNTITSYKNNKTFNKEISLLSLMNIEQGLYNKFIDFNRKYQKFVTNIPTYDLNKLFKNVENYIGKKVSINTLPNNIRSSLPSAYVKTFSVETPFDINKFLRISPLNIVIKDNKYVSIPDLVLFNRDKEYISNNKELINMFVINNSKSDMLDFNKVLSNKSITVTSRLLNFNDIKKVHRTNLIEDYKITNTVVPINDVVTKLPQDVVSQPKITDTKRQINDELFRKIVHTTNGTIAEYQQADNLNVNYYYEFALFNSQNLKDVNWLTLTKKSLTGLRSSDKIFCRLVPNMVDLKIQSNIFDFSYDINQIKTVGEIINYAS